MYLYFKLKTSLTANGPKKVAASRMQTNLISLKLHAAGGHPGSICMRQAAKWQRRALLLATRCKLNLYVTGCRLGNFCMRLVAAPVRFANN